jgi:hypothetical protein
MAQALAEGETCHVAAFANLLSGSDKLIDF